MVRAREALEGGGGEEGGGGGPEKAPMAFSVRSCPPATRTGLTALLRKAAAASTAAVRLALLLRRG